MKPTVAIRSLTCALPSKALPNGGPAFAELRDVPEAWYEFWGIYSRQAFDRARGESETWLAGEVSARAVRAAGIEPGQLDMILANITSPFVTRDGSDASRRFAPRLSGLLREHLGAGRALNFDIEAECASFLFQMQMAANYIRQGRARHVLVCSAEWFSSLLDYSCKSSINFGDGAAAAVLSAGDADSPYDLLDSVYRSDGEHYGLATAKWRHSRKLEAAGAQARSEAPQDYRAYFTLKSQTKDEIARFMPETIPGIAQRLLDQNGLRGEDVDAVVFHQPAQTLVDGWAATLGVPRERYVVKLADCACLASVSVPIAMHESLRRGVIQPGHRVLIAGAGAGWSFGAQLWRVGAIATGDEPLIEAPRAVPESHPSAAEA